MFCNKCGSQLADNTAFCSGCGAMQGAAASKSGILSFLPASWQSILNKVLKSIQADKRRVLIILAVLILFIVFVGSLGGELSGTYIGENEGELKFSGSSCTLSYGAISYKGTYKKIEDNNDKEAYQLMIAIPDSTTGVEHNYVLYAVKNGRNLLVKIEDSEIMFRKK